MELFGDTRETYLDFAERATDSPTFVAWARGVADDEEVLAWLAGLPVLKRQPNLVFAAARWHGLAPTAAYADLRVLLLGDGGPVRATILSRATQTNEAGRMATLLPLLAQVAREDGPIALLEVGASGGLTLHPDRWSHRYLTPDGPVVVGDPADPVLECEVRGPAPLPSERPEIRWRGGLDLHPLDVGDPDTAAWLETLVWPEHEDRRRVLRRAIEVARHSPPPRIVEGDLLVDLDPLIEEASRSGRVVVQHTAVLAYVEEPDRDRFTDQMLARVDAGACRWISNEAPRVLPRVRPADPRHGGPPPGDFVLGLDGTAVAWTHGHGRSLTWLD